MVHKIGDGIELIRDSSQFFKLFLSLITIALIQFSQQFWSVYCGLIDLPLKCTGFAFRFETSLRPDVGRDSPILG